MKLGYKIDDFSGEASFIEGSLHVIYGVALGRWWVCDLFDQS